MAKIYKNRPNFLGSEVGLTLKTITVPADFATYVVENDRKIVVAGTIFTQPYFGLLFQDIDITDGAQEASLMIGGRYIDEKLPATANAQVNNFRNQGLYAIVEGEVERPDFGTVGMTALANPVTAVANANITWEAIANAKGYNVYDSKKEFITSVTATQYTATAIGTYYIQAKADNINYKSSALVEANVANLG